LWSLVYDCLLFLVERDVLDEYVLNLTRLLMFVNLSQFCRPDEGDRFLLCICWISLKRALEQ
jgi:hypothetical protein